MNYQEIKINNESHFKHLINIIKTINPILIVFDSLVRFHNANENDAGEMSAVMENFRRIVNLGTSVLIIHHHNKGSNSLETRSRGSSDIIGIVDIEYSLTKEHGNLILQTVKCRRKPIEPINLEIVASDTNLCFRYIGTEEDSQKILMQKIIDFVTEGQAGVREILEYLLNSGLQIHEKKLREILNFMTQKNYLKVMVGGRGRRLYQPV